MTQYEGIAYIIPPQIKYTKQTNVLSRAPILMSAATLESTAIIVGLPGYNRAVFPVEWPGRGRRDAEARLLVLSM